MPSSGQSALFSARILKEDWGSDGGAGHQLYSSPFIFSRIARPQREGGLLLTHKNKTVFILLTPSILALSST